MTTDTKSQDRSAEATARLTALRAQLVAVEAEAQAADAEMDAVRLTMARQQADTLRGFIARTEAQAADAETAAVRQDAAQWLAGHGARMEAARHQLVTAADAVRPHFDAALAALREEATLRSQWDACNEGALVLALRFGLAAPTRPLAPSRAELPEALMEAIDALQTPRRERRLTVGAPASATADQRRELTMRALTQFIATHRRSLPPEVQAMLAAAPITDAECGVRPKPERPHEAHATAAMAQRVWDTERVLASLPGAASGGIGV